jgi:hypothetical protein
MVKSPLPQAQLLYQPAHEKGMEDQVETTGAAAMMKPPAAGFPKVV